MADTPGGLVKISMQFTRAQMAWIRARASRTGSVGLAAAVRMVIQAAIDAEQPPERRAS